MKDKNNSKIFYFSIISFFTGIFFSSTVDYFNIIFAFFAFTVLFFVWVYLIYKKKNVFFFNIFLLISLFFFLGSIWFNTFYNNKYGHFDNLLNIKSSFNLVVDDEPEIKGWHTKLILKDLNTGDRFISWVNNLPKYEYGDELNLTGWTVPIRNFKDKNDSVNNFDYINFLKKDNIFYEIKKPSIIFINNKQGNFLKQKLFLFKKEIIKQIKKLLPEPESSLLAGILIGAKEDMGENLLEKFRETGIIHIIVLSGFNLTILAQFIMILLSVFGRKISAIFGSLSIILFALMTGASATIVRASLMALLVIFARVMGRNSEAIKLLFLAGFIMLLFNPMLLLYDASFQLSFLATLGLLTLSPKIESLIKFGDFKLFNFKEILGATLSTQIFVFPLILYMMGEISLVSPIVNILILVLVPFSMIWGVFTLLISYISLGLALLLSYPNHLILSYDLKIVDIFSGLNFSTFKLENFSAISMFLVYGFYILVFIIWKKLRK